MIQKFYLRAIVAVTLTACVASPALADKANGTLRFAADQPIQTVSYYYDPSPDAVFESGAGSVQNLSHI